MWSFLKRTINKPKGLSCVSFNTDGVAFVHVTDVSERQLEITHCDFLSAKDRYQQALLLSQYIKKNGLVNADCACILNPTDYRLLLLDAPNVPEKELKQATRFLIKDLIDAPIQKVAVDFFEVPTLAAQKEKIYVVAAKMKLLKKITQSIELAGLNPFYIDIAELALRNLLILREEITNGVALLFIHAGSLHVVVVHENDVCFARQISAGVQLQLDQSAISFEDLITKFQQTFDYYQTQIAKDPPSKLLLAPMINVSDAWLSKVQDGLGMVVEKLDLNTWLTLKKPLDKELQARCLMPIAEALQMNEIVAKGESAS
jgi:MSHA biogenesis protein MshI